MRPLVATVGSCHAATPSRLYRGRRQSMKIMPPVLVLFFLANAATAAPLIACHVDALNKKEWHTLESKLVPRMTAAVTGVKELPDGYSFRFPASAVPLVGDGTWYVARCCPMVDYRIGIGAAWSKSMTLPVHGRVGAGCSTPWSSTNRQREVDGVSTPRSGPMCLTAASSGSWSSKGMSTVSPTPSTSMVPRLPSPLNQCASVESPSRSDSHSPSPTLASAQGRPCAVTARTASTSGAEPGAATYRVKMTFPAASSSSAFRLPRRRRG